MGVDICGREGRGGGKGTGSEEEAGLHCLSAKVGPLVAPGGLRALAFLSCIESVIGYGLFLGGGMTLGEAVIFHQKNSQRGLTAETDQLTAISASGGGGGSAFHSQRGIW